MPPRERLEEIRSYYGRILPFYEKESTARAHLDFWRRLVRRWRPTRILELGAGLGRITKALASDAPAVGVDISIEMLARAASETTPRAHFVAADIRRVGFACDFDLIVAPSDPFSHLLTKAERRQTLRCVSRLLSPGGRFVLEGLYCRGRRIERRERRIRHAKGILSIAETWRPIGTRELWRACYRYRDCRRGESPSVLEACFTARAWEARSLRRLFETSGLKVEELWGDLDRRPFWRGADRIVVVARRRRDSRAAVSSAPRETSR